MSNKNQLRPLRLRWHTWSDLQLGQQLSACPSFCLFVCQKNKKKTKRQNKTLSVTALCLYYRSQYLVGSRTWWKKETFALWVVRRSGQVMIRVTALNYYLPCGTASKDLCNFATCMIFGLCYIFSSSFVLAIMGIWCFHFTPLFLFPSV